MISTTQERVERSIYEAIRLKLIAEGYLPDITLYPNTAQGQTDYNTALTTIKADKGFSIELFSIGSNFDKGEKKVPRIVIMDGRFMNGDLGSQPEPRYELDEDTQTYQALVAPAETYNYEFDIHLVSNKASELRILNAILAQVIGARKYLKYWDDATQVFLIQQYNYYELPDTEDGIIEKIFSFHIPDLYISEDEVVKDNISPIKEIKILRDDTDNQFLDVT